MSAKTSIEWTGSTWNPLRGTKGRWHCVRISDACKHCYAAVLNHRFGGPDYVKGADTPRLDEKALTLPLRWREPRKVFVCSMTDLFLDEHPDEWIDRVFAVMALAPQHTFQVLTKRPERMRRYFAGDAEKRTAVASLDFKSLRGPSARWELDVQREITDGWGKWPLPNVWLGVSVEDQATADVRIPELLATPAAVRFVSYEPALGPVDFSRLSQAAAVQVDALRGAWEIEHDPAPDGSHDGGLQVDEGGPRLDWIIVGGESGPGARPFDIAWARSTIAQCRAAGVACFVKQLGLKPYAQAYYTDTGALAGGVILNLRDRKGGDWSEWPEDLRVREFPTAQKSDYTTGDQR